MHEIAYKNLIDYLGFKEEIGILDPLQRLALASENVLKTLDVDTRYIYPNPPSFWKYKEENDGTWIDEFGIKFKKVGYYSDVVEPPLKGKTFDEIKQYRFPDPFDKNRFDGLKEKSKYLYENTEFALVSGAVFDVYCPYWKLRGLEEALIDVSINRSIANYILDKIMDWTISFGSALLDEIGDFIEYWWIADDWGTQQGPLIRPEVFREIFKPRLAKVISYLKSRTNAKCCYHSCGSIYWCIQDLIDVGIDIIHPLQPNAYGNDDTARIKKEFGDKISFHGGTNNQGLFHSNLIDVQIDTLARNRDLAPGGGYIFSSGHNIQPNCPPQNIIGLIDIAKRFGNYPIDIQLINEEISKLIDKKF